MVDLDGLVKQAHDMEPMPPSGARLAQIIADPASTIESIVEAASLDQALAGRVLRSANSAASAPRAPIHKIRDAVVRLGRHATLALALGTRVRSELQQPIPAYGFAENGLWKHSVATALATEALAAHCKASLPPSAYAAALLHDLGKLVFVRFFDPELLAVVDRAQNEGGCTPIEAEREVLEVDHAETGAHLARHWGLPEPIALGIQYHHAPENQEELTCHVVCVADEVAKLAVPGQKVPPHPENHAEAAERLGLTPNGREEAAKVVAERLAKVLELYGAS
ncbi:MAG: HDOD domain-containing protein [Myxococcales bacterium]